MMHSMHIPIYLNMCEVSKFRVENLIFKADACATTSEFRVNLDKQMICL